MNHDRDDEKPFDDVPLTAFEKRVFRIIIFSSLACFVIFGVVGWGFEIAALNTAAFIALPIACIFSLFWYIQACVVSMRDYGLGEGVANLYGEDRAKFQFGEHYMRPERKND